MRTPRTTPSRRGPRKPGHSARVSVAAAAAVGLFEASGDGDGEGDAVAVVVVGAVVVGVAGCAGSLVVSASSRSSELFDQRQPNAAW